MKTDHKHHSVLKKSLLFLAALSLLLFACVTYLVRQDALRTIDFSLLVKIQNHIPISLNPLFSIFGSIGSFWVNLIFVFIITLTLKKTKHRLLFVSLFVFAHILELGLKLFLTQPGPPFQFHRFATDYFFDKDYVVEGSSFFSGHTFRSVYVGIIAIYQIMTSSTLQKILRIGMSIAILMTASLIIISKLALGQHWVSDVVAGKLMGLSFASFFLFLLLDKKSTDL